MRPFVLFFILLLLLNGCKKDPIVDVLNPHIKPGWELTFHDEFNTEKFDSSKWRPDYRFGRYHGLTEDHCASSDNFEFQNGSISLVLKPEPGECTLWTDKGLELYPTNYTAGLLCSSETFEQTYGFFEIRCRIPSGQGLTSAFWLASNQSWPPEIDIFESQGNQPGKLYVSHSQVDHANGFRRHFYFTDLSKEFHTYAVEWTPNKIRYYLDNNLLTETSQKIPEKPMHIIASLGVGGGIDGCGFSGCPDYTTVFPAKFTIDYIRVYKKLN